MCCVVGHHAVKARCVKKSPVKKVTTYVFPAENSPAFGLSVALRPVLLFLLISVELK